MITYQVEEFTDTDSSVEVIYTNEKGFVHKRTLNIPRNSDGSLNEEMWEEILEGQLRGVERKIEVNAISFVDPSTDNDSTEVTPNPQSDIEKNSEPV
jgi:hypothetical protein